VLALVFGRRLSDIDKTVQPTEGLKLIGGVPMFGPLSLAMKERVAASLLPVAVRAGETVIHAGEPGDRFYIVGAGQLGIERAGMHLINVGPGDYFGEIAQLEGVPRTASVTAVAESELYALRREAFLAAVTGHPQAVALARQVVTERRPENRRQPLHADDPRR
jgi:CRP-like cAMP-binding protein